MDYEKLHKDTIAKLQEMVNSGKITVEIACGICADFVPESEDERITKEIISAIKEDWPGHTDWISWLEKQDKQKSSWNKEDELTRNALINLVETYYGGCIDKSGKNRLLDFLKSLKDRYTWKPSEEMLEALYRVIPENVMEKSENEILLDKLYQGLKYGRVLSKK